MSEYSRHMDDRERSRRGVPPTGGGTDAGALGLLLNALFGKGGPESAQAALGLGGTSSIGALAWSFYNKWARDNGRNASGASQPAYASPEHALNRAVQESSDAGEPASRCIGDPALARLLIRALTGACRAGGGLDAEQCRRVGDAVKRVNPDPGLSVLLDGFLRETTDVNALAAEIRSQDQAQDLYRLSCALVEGSLPGEQRYLRRLAEALDIPDAVREKIEEEARYTRSRPSSAC